MHKILNKVVMLLLALTIVACESFLDEKPDKKLVVPGTLNDLQALLDYFSQVNFSFPNAAEISAGDFYLTDAHWEALSREEDRRMYTWEPTHVFREASNDWSYSYRILYTANTVLEGIGDISRNTANVAGWDNVKGQALYTRANYLLQNAFVWAPAYDAATSGSDLGIPLRLHTDFNVPSARASVQETYDQILMDLQEAAPLLPVKSMHPMRPSRAAAYGLLARTYLAMRNYEQAAEYAHLSLQLHSTLLDYNTLNPAASYPFSNSNPEIVMINGLSGIVNALNIARAKIVPDLYNQYGADDLRKTVFFRRNSDGSYGFKGSPYGTSGIFGGVATDELYLTRAEAYARIGRVAEAMQDLNTLLVTRWKTGTFVPFTAETKEEALTIILRERRKQLLMRGLRWMDIKRLNKEGANITLTRTVKGQTYTLPPNDPRFALPIPEDVIGLSGMKQNPR